MGCSSLLPRPAFLPVSHQAVERAMTLWANELRGSSITNAGRALAS